jgi:purine-cytosine permease-like protein
VTGTALVGGGFLGFLPVLGFWMVPLGLIVLSHDLPAVRRRRRRMTVWWNRRKATPRSGRED